MDWREQIEACHASGQYQQALRRQHDRAITCSSTGDASLKVDRHRVTAADTEEALELLPYLAEVAMTFPPLLATDK